MRELEASLQQFGEFMLKAELVRAEAAPYFVRWVRRFLSRPASDEPLADQVRVSARTRADGRCEDWQVRQAEQALRIYFVNFLKRTDWQRSRPARSSTNTGTRVRWRHSSSCGTASDPSLSYRTECSYVDWVRRFLD